MLQCRILSNCFFSKLTTPIGDNIVATKIFSLEWKWKFLKWIFLLMITWLFWTKRLKERKHPSVPGARDGSLWPILGHAPSATSWQCALWFTFFRCFDPLIHPFVFNLIHLSIGFYIVKCFKNGLNKMHQFMKKNWLKMPTLLGYQKSMPCFEHLCHSFLVNNLQCGSAKCDPFYQYHVGQHHQEHQGPSDFRVRSDSSFVKAAAILLHHELQSGT